MKNNLLLGATLASLLASGAAIAQDYPTRPITIVVGATAGGGTDIQARILAEKLTAELGQQVLVENQPGAGSNIASAYVANAAPDGYTLNVAAAAVVINHTLYANPGFDATTDFTPVAGWGSSPLVFVTNPELPVSTLQELADYSKAHPGELDYGNGVGFINQMVMELFKIDSGADIQFVPYPGLAPARTDVIGGIIETTVDSVDSAGPFLLGGELKALATTAAERLPNYPDLPTTTEAGFPNVNQQAWYGVLAPAGTPEEIVDMLATAIAKIQADPANAALIMASGATPMIAGPEEFGAFFNKEVETWADVIARAEMPKVE